MRLGLPPRLVLLLGPFTNGFFGVSMKPFFLAVTTDGAKLIEMIKQYKQYKMDFAEPLKFNTTNYYLCK